MTAKEPDPDDTADEPDHPESAESDAGAGSNDDDPSEDEPRPEAGTRADDQSDPEPDATTGTATPTDDRKADGGDGSDGGDPLDVTEDDLDATEIDQEDLDRVVELLDEARDDPDTVESRDLENLLTVFDDAGIDTGDLDVDTLEERFDEALKVSRMLVSAAANTGEYTGLASLRAGSRMAEAAFTSESPRDLLEETTDIARDELTRLGLPFGSASRRETASTPDRSDRRTHEENGERGPVTAEDLRRRGNRLLELSADVDHEEPFHPAYVRVIEQLSTDEARILRLLATEGPQPALDVVDKGFLPFGSHEVLAEGLTMLDTDAGLRYEDRAAVYIDNLERLGLVRVSDNMLHDLEQYRVLQAQPNVEAAGEGARSPGTVRRSVRLTPMGVDFCRVVFSFDLADRYDEDDGD